MSVVYLAEDLRLKRRIDRRDALRTLSRGPCLASFNYTRA